MHLCPPKLRWIVCVAVCVHILCVLAEPLRFFSRSEIRPTAPEFGMLRQITAPYAEWMYLDHGYFFFAPNPGPGHLVGCSIIPKGTDGGASEPKKWIFPDKNEMRPRLLYHRFFMLSEFYNDRFAPEDIPAEVKKDEEFVNRWKFDRGFYESLQGSIVRSLIHHHEAESVKLSRIERMLPESEQVLRDGWKLNDPRLSSTLMETLVAPTSQPAPTGPPAELPPATGTRTGTPGVVNPLAEPIRSRIELGGQRP